MKRFIAIMLSLITLFSSIFSLSGCSSEDSQDLKIGQWLMMINDSFGMESYVQEEPYFSNINTDNPYYETIQIATEWEIINNSESIDVDKTVTWKDALITLVNAGNFEPVDSSEEEKIEQAINTFDNSIRKYWMNRKIKYEDAVVLLAKAQEIWANQTYDENIENVKYNENVEDLTNSVSSDYELKNNVVSIDEKYTENIQEGDIYILPSKDNQHEYIYNRAKSVKTENGVTYIENTNEELEIEDVLQELQLQGTVVPTTENTMIYDGNGQLISDNINVSSQNTQGVNSYDTEPLLLTGTPEVQNCASSSMSHTFKIDGYEVGLSYNLDGALDLKVSVKTPNILGSDKHGSLKGEASAEVSGLKVSHDFDLGFTGLKHALLKVDYNTKTKFGVKYSAKPIDAVAAPEYSNGNGKFLTNFKRAILKDRDGLGAKTIASKKTIKVCSLNVYSVGVAKICLDVNVQLAVDGSFTVTVTEGGSKGVEYKNGNLRFIKTSNKNAEAELKGNIELTLGFGPALYVIGLKNQLLGFEIRGGVGASASLKWHMADAERHLIEELSFSDTQSEVCEMISSVSIDADPLAIKAVAESQGGIYSAEEGVSVKLHLDTCFDVSLYGILKLGLTDSSYAAKFLGGKVKLSVTVFDSKNAKFFNMHVDNWNWSEALGNIKWGSAASNNNCTLEYVPFDSAEDEGVTETTQEETYTSSEEIIKGDFIVLSSIRADIVIGNKYCVNVTQIPKGYELSDLKFTSNNEKIASVNNAGVITGVDEGSTTIVVSTSDGKYKAVVAVTITTNEKAKFEGLKV